MAGLLDFEDPQQAGLLALAQGLFAAGAPQNRRVGLGEALAGGMGNMQQAQMQAEMLRRKKQEQDMQMQIQQMKFGQMQQEIEKQKAMEDAMVSFAKFKQGGSLPSSKIDGGEFYRAAEKHGLGTDNESLNRIVNLVNQGGHTPDSAAASLSGRNAPSSVQGFSMPTAQSQNDRVMGNYQPQSMSMQAPPQQAPQQQGFNKGDIVKSQISELMQQAKFYSSRPDYQSQMLAQQAQAQAIKLANELPKFANDFKVGRDKAGNLVNVRVADDGTETYSPTQVAEELHFGDNGQQLIASGKYSGNTKTISQKQQTPDSQATNARLWSEFNFKKQQDAAPTWNNEVGAFIGRPTKENPNGVKVELAGYAKEDKPLTEVQSKAVTFASRMKNANEVINGLSSEGVDKSSAGKKFIEAIPMIGGGLGSVYNATLPENIQKLDQAKRDWINANLRNESGAAIGKDEFYSADQQYFPQIGDKPEVIKQKAINRQLAEDGMRAQAGKGAARIDSIVSGVKAPSYSSGAAAPKSVLKGQIMDGYKFKGGNPADPNAWEKL